MLTLGRHVGQRIFIFVGEVKIEVSVLSAYGGKAKLGFEAPLEANIVREEVYDSQATKRVTGET